MRWTPDSLQSARSHEIHFTSPKTHQIQQLICSGFKAAEVKVSVFHYKLPKRMHFHLWPHSLYFELHKQMKVTVKTIAQCHPG